MEGDGSCVSSPNAEAQGDAGASRGVMPLIYPGDHRGHGLSITNQFDAAAATQILPRLSGTGELPNLIAGLDLVKQVSPLVIAETKRNGCGPQALVGDHILGFGLFHGEFSSWHRPKLPTSHTERQHEMGIPQCTRPNAHVPADGNLMDRLESPRHALAGVINAGRGNCQAMMDHSNATKQAAPVSGFHAGGHDAYHRAAGTGDRMNREEAKLYRRIKLSCKPRGILGNFILILRRRRLVLKLRRRFRKPQALFITNQLLVQSKPGPSPNGRMDSH